MTARTPPPSPPPGRARLVRSLTPPSLHALPGRSPPRHPVYARLRREAALPLADARAEAAYCQRVADEDALCRLLDTAFSTSSTSSTSALAEGDGVPEALRAPRLLHSLSGSALRTARKHAAAAACVSPLAPRLPKPPTRAPAPVAVPQPAVPAPAAPVAAAAPPPPAPLATPATTVEPPPRSSSAPPLPWDDMT